MKKLFYWGIMMIALVCWVACSGDNTPSGAMKSYLSALQSGDYEKLIDGTAFLNSDPAKVEELKETLVAFYKEKGQKELEAKGGIRQTEILSEEIAEDAKSAIVRYKLVYGNGEESEDTQKLVSVDGKWLMDSGK